MHEMPDDLESSGAAVPPPLLFAGGLALGLGLGRAGGDERGPAVARAMGWAAVVGGALIGATAIAALKGAKTNVSPYAPAKALVTGGIFRVTRNPAYVGATSIYIGIAMLARSVPALVMLPVVLALLDRGVVDREERYLERRFGDAYRTYRQEVPRWF
jgi:protein-S-isoprenylcysteine O-methyltransferase Ste14